MLLNTMLAVYTELAAYKLIPQGVKKIHQRNILVMWRFYVIH